MQINVEMWQAEFKVWFKQETEKEREINKVCPSLCTVLCFKPVSWRSFPSHQILAGRTAAKRPISINIPRGFFSAAFLSLVPDATPSPKHGSRLTAILHSSLTRTPLNYICFSNSPDITLSEHAKTDCWRPGRDIFVSLLLLMFLWPKIARGSWMLEAGRPRSQQVALISLIPTLVGLFQGGRVPVVLCQPIRWTGSAFPPCKLRQANHRREKSTNHARILHTFTGLPCGNHGNAVIELNGKITGIQPP